MRLSVYILGHRVFVVDVTDTSNATFLQQPEKLVERGVKKISRAWTSRLFR